MVNFIKSKPLKSWLFNDLCSAMDSDHTQLLFHTEVRWLSRGRVLQRFYELREKLMIFFTCEESQYADFLRYNSWCTVVAFLLGKLNYLNKSMQGKKENILTSTDKIVFSSRSFYYGLQKLKNRQLGICLNLPRTVILTQIFQI